MCAAQSTAGILNNTYSAPCFTAIETSASGYPSEGNIKGLFADFDTTSNRLGSRGSGTSQNLFGALFVPPESTTQVAIRRPWGDCGKSLCTVMRPS